MKTITTTLLALLLASAHAFADEPAVYTGLLSNTGAGGYDVVGYFDQGEPVKGSTRYTAEYLGATWRFASQEHLDRFRENPERYAPQYGGYCAWAASEGYLAKGDPKYWSVVDGRLYLNYNQTIQERWQADMQTHIRRANANWPGILKE